MKIEIDASKNAVVTVSLISLLIVTYISLRYYFDRIALLAQIKDSDDKLIEKFKEELKQNKRQPNSWSIKQENIPKEKVVNPYKNITVNQTKAEKVKPKEVIEVKKKRKYKKKKK